MKRFFKNHRFNSLLLRIWWRCKHFEYKLQVRTYEEKFDIFWPLYCLSIFNLPFWLTIWCLLATLVSVHLRFTVLITRTGNRVVKRYQRVIKTVNRRWTDNRVAKRYQRGNKNGKLKMDRICNHSIVCPSSIYRFDYPFGIF
jgi:hypothetical protein